jgi:hypothetical protein
LICSSWTLLTKCKEKNRRKKKHFLQFPAIESYFTLLKTSIDFLIFFLPPGLEDCSNWSEKNYYFWTLLYRVSPLWFSKGWKFCCTNICFLEKSFRKIMLPTWILIFRFIIGAEYFKKFLTWKKVLDVANTLFIFESLQFYFLNFNTIVIRGVRFLLWLAMTIWWSCLVDFSSWWSCPVYISSRWLYYGWLRFS